MPPQAPTPPTSAPVTYCPVCHAEVSGTSRFCNSCGASLTQASPVAMPSTGAGPVDIRQKVDADRGFLKRLQLLIPGYRGYRLGEDIREADSLLRLQIADKVHQSVVSVQDCRTALANAGQFAVLTSLTDTLSDLQRLEGEIRHAEQGYSGISAATRVRPEQLDSLYQFDYGFAQAADQLLQTLGPLRDAAGNPNGAGANDALTQTRAQVRALDTAFKSRMSAVQGILVS